MKGITGLELSAKKAEYLKYIYENEEIVRTTALAAYFRVAPSTTTKTLEGIARMGLIEHTPYHGVRLTQKGENYARFLVRRHRILSLMFSQFGLSPVEACREATKIEGAVSKDVVDKICASLGHPVMSVCGRIEHDRCCCCPPVEAAAGESAMSIYENR